MDYNKEAILELSELAKTFDDTVKYNEYSGRVLSHRDGTQYIPLEKALIFAQEYNSKYVRKKKLNDLLDG